MSTFITRRSRIEQAAAGGAEGGQRRLEPIAGAHRHELAGLLREELADRAGVPAPNRDAGEDERPGVDGVGILPCSPY